MSSLPTVGFIGLGVMGRSMARHIRSAGYPLLVYNRTRARADEILGLGAQWRDSAGAVAKDADVVITIVGYPRDVEEVYFGADGILAQARPDSLLIDMTTSTPALARRIADAARERGCAALDAPVSGGDIGAREARLTIMVGGEAAAFERAQPIFQKIGRTITLMGAAGAGQHTKMCNQIAIAFTCKMMLRHRERGRQATQPGREMRKISTEASVPGILALRREPVRRWRSRATVGARCDRFGPPCIPDYGHNTLNLNNILYKSKIILRSSKKGLQSLQDLV